MGQDPNLVKDENGAQTVKAWKTFKETQDFEGFKSNGEPMTPLDIKKAVWVYRTSCKTEEY